MHAILQRILIKTSVVLYPLMAVVPQSAWPCLMAVVPQSARPGLTAAAPQNAPKLDHYNITHQYESSSKFLLAQLADNIIVQFNWHVSKIWNVKYLCQ